MCRVKRVLESDLACRVGLEEERLVLERPVEGVEAVGIGWEGLFEADWWAGDGGVDDWEWANGMCKKKDDEGESQRENLHVGGVVGKNEFRADVIKNKQMERY